MAITGKGAYPFRSSWIKKTSQLEKSVFVGGSGSHSPLFIDFFFQPTSTFFGILKRWTGLTWAKAKLMEYNGTWVAKKLKRWDGSSWKEVDATGI